MRRSLSDISPITTQSQHPNRPTSPTSTLSSPTHDQLYSPSPSSRVELPLSQERYPALTSERLAKKNKLDAIKQKMMSSKRRSLRRRQSIASGQIYRLLPYYQHDLDVPEDTRSSIKPNYGIGSEDDDEGRSIPHGKMYSSSSQRTLPDSKLSYSSEYRTGNFQNSPGRSGAVSSISVQKSTRRKSMAKTIHQAVKRKRSVCPPSPAINLGLRNSNILAQQKEFLKFLTLSSSSSSSYSTPDKTTLSQSYKSQGLSFIHQCWQQMQLKLAAMAKRVMDVRGCELTPTKMTVKETLALVDLLRTLQKESHVHLPNYQSDNDNDGNTEQRMQQTQRVIHSEGRRPTSTELAEAALTATMDETSQSNRNSIVEEHTITERDNVNTNTNNRAHQQRKLGSFAQIFPFGPTRGDSSLGSTLSPASRSSAEPSQKRMGQSPHLSATNWEQQPTSKRPSLGFNVAHRLSYALGIDISNSDQLTLDDDDDKSDDNDGDHDGYVQFDGWSLWAFSPSSKIRLYLWTVIASSWYELLSFALLFVQWLVLSCTSIQTHQQKLSSSTTQQFILFIVNIILLFEIVAKCVIYGFVSSQISTAQPNLRQNVKTFVLSKVLRKINADNISKDLPTPSATQDSSSQDNEYPNFRRSVAGSPTVSSNDAFSNSDDGRTSRQAPWVSVPLRPDSGYNCTESRLHSPMTSSIASHIDSQDHQQLEVSPIASDNPPFFDAKSVKEKNEPSSLDYVKINHDPVFRHSRCALDFISVSAFWLQFLINSDTSSSILAALASLRILRFLTVTEGTTVIMESLRACFDILCNVFGFFVFFWMLFSLVALFLFTNSFSRQCAVIPDGGLHKNIQNITYANPPQRCNSFYDSPTHRSGVFDIDTGMMIKSQSNDGFTCQLGHACIQRASNLPGWGFINYNNIFYAMLNIFTVFSTEGWTDLMYMSNDSVSRTASSIFYCFCLYLMTFIMVPMFIAVITTSLSNLRGTLRQSAFARQRKRRVLLFRPSDSDRNRNTSNEYVKDNQRANDNTDEVSGHANDTWTYEGDQAVNHQRLRRHTHRLRSWLTIFVNNKWFVYFGSLLVVMNTLAMAAFSAKDSGHQTDDMHVIEFVFSFVFTVEILIRMAAYTNLSGFWLSNRNRIDFVLVIGSLCNTLFVPTSSRLHQVLEIFAVARCYRLVYLFPSVLHLLSDVIGDGQGIFNLTFFTFMVLFLFSPIAMQLFGGDFQDTADIDDPVMRFDSFYQSFLSLFQIMTGENWTDILYDAMHSQSYTTPVFAGLFMLFIYLVIHYIVLNLFIAVIMENFDLDEDEIRQIQIKKYIRQHRWQPEYFRLDIISRFLLPVFVKQGQRRLKVKHLPQDLVATVTRSEFQQFLKPDNAQDFQQLYFSAPARSSSLPRHRPLGRTVSNLSAVSSHTVTRNDMYLNHERNDPLVKYGDEYELNVAKENKAMIMENLELFRSVVVFKPNNPLRRWCAKLTRSRLYTNTMICFVCISWLLTIYSDNQFRMNHLTAAQTIEYIQRGLLLTFFVNAFMFMINTGIIMLPESYLRNIWHLLDFSSLVAQVVIILWVQNDKIGKASILRCLRTLRVIYLIHYIKGTRVIFSDIVYGLPKLLNAATLNFLVFVPFAIYGCYLFAGRFSLCNDNGVQIMVECLWEYQSVGDTSQGILIPRIWDIPYRYSFDSFDKALLHLFECASGEGWILSLFTAMSVAPSTEIQPKFNWYSSSVWYSTYYIVFMFVASLCTIQLFIGVFLESFKQRSGISSLTNAQRQFQDLQRQLSLVKPSRKAVRPRGDIRGKCYDFVVDKNGRFTRMMASVSLANIAVFVSKFLNQPFWLSNLQDRLYFGFLVIYTVEITIKVLGLGLNKLTSSRWNIYDIVVVLCAITSSALKVFLDESFTLDVVFTISQIGIAFRLAQRIDSLDTLLRSTQKALPSIFYATSAFVLVMLCFAVIFQETFDWTRYGPYGNHNANFRTLSTSFLTLFRITTGENWDFLMHDFTIQPPNCVQGKDCGSPIAAYILFILFYVVCTYIFVNLFTVVVISNFSFTFDKQNKFTLLTRTDLRHFKSAWEGYDPKGTGFIQKEDIPGFLRDLQGALAVRIYKEPHSLSNLLKASDQMDADMTHLASVPLSSSRLQNQFAANNILGERYYNYYEVNKELSTMDVAHVRASKEEYNRIYHEILLTASSRGVAFHNILQTLALRLVDPTKALTFAGFVEWSKQQENIRKILATEKAANAVNMLTQRRQYMKERLQAQEEQMLDVSMYDDLPTPSSGSSSTGSADYELQRHSSVIIEPPSDGFPTGRYIYDSNLASGTERQQSISHVNGSPIPLIIIDNPPSHPQVPSSPPSHMGSRTVSPPPPFSHHIRSPHHSPPIGSASHTRHPLSPIMGKRRAIIAGKQPVRRGQSPQGDALVDSSHRLTDRKEENGDFRQEKDNQYVLDTFTMYYAMDADAGNMTIPDVAELVQQLEHSPWSELLWQELSEEPKEGKGVKMNGQ